MESETTAPQSDMMDYDLIMNNFSEDQLYQNLFPQEDIFLNSPLPLLNTQEEPTPDYFRDLDEIQPTVYIKPDPDAPLQLPQSPQLIHDSKKRRVSSSDSTAKKHRTQPIVKTQAKGNVKKEEDHESKGEEGEKYFKRLEANKKSAQASRERKKHLRDELEKKLSEISAQNTKMATEITQLETENKVLKGEFIQLQKLISDSAVLSKLMERATSMQLAANDNERTMKAAPMNYTPSTSELSSNASAFLHLMIILQSFGHYFASMPQSPNSNFMNLRYPLEVM
jgi:hypothetical protein